MIGTIWHLSHSKNPPKILVSTTNSGKWKHISIRILWSKRLGLDLRSKIKSERLAKETVAKMIERGYINLLVWEKVYYPHKNFLKEFHDK